MGVDSDSLFFFNPKNPKIIETTPPAHTPPPNPFPPPHLTPQGVPGPLRTHSVTR